MSPGYSDLLILADFMGWPFIKVVETILSFACERYSLRPNAGIDSLNEAWARTHTKQAPLSATGGA
jgi:hypothetical protein